MKKLHIAASPLTGTIFCGHRTKYGQFWAAGKQDLTIEALIAVIDHALLFKSRSGEDVIITDAEGAPEYKITVDILKDKLKQGE